MSKTPEEMAEEYVNDLGQDFDRLFPSNAEQPFIETFLAGYKAAAPQWVSVEAARPEWASFIHVITDSGEQKICRYFGTFDTEINGVRSPEPVTHWMPLPEPPKEDE